MNSIDTRKLQAPKGQLRKFFSAVRPKKSENFLSYGLLKFFDDHKLVVIPKIEILQ